MTLPLLALINQLADASRNVAPSAGQVNWLNITGVFLGIVGSVTVIVVGIKTAIRKMMTEIADDCIDIKIEKLMSDHITPIERTLYEIKGELRSITR